MIHVCIRVSTILLMAGGICRAEHSPPIVKPTPLQVEWQDMELGMFVHYGDRTFAKADLPRVKRNSTVGDCVVPDAFNPAAQNTDQWMEAAKAFGAKYAVLTARHGSGFCIWPTEAYPYSVKQSKWKNGRGDVLREFTDSCRKAGITPGIYCVLDSNGYLDVPPFGHRVKSRNPEEQKRYNAACEKTLTEVWSNYGPLGELWFDNGVLPVAQGGPNVEPLIKKLQPDAMVFGAPYAATIRWVGNEMGRAPYPCWATTKESVPERGGGDPEGRYWRPAEADTGLRSYHWFWKPDDEGMVQSLHGLMTTYYLTVGRNCNLLLNVPPDRRGLIPDADMRRLREFGAEIRRRFGKSLAETNGRGEIVELALEKPVSIDHVMLMEQIAEGERVREFVVEGFQEGKWLPLCKGSCIGHKFIERFQPVEVAKVRLRVAKSIAEPLIRKLAVYHVGPDLPDTPDTPAAKTAAAETKSPLKEIAVDLGGGVKLEMVRIPAGEFMMGDERNMPVHKVVITKPFFLGKYEVTREQWETVMGNRNPSHSQKPVSPSWRECQKFLDKLNAKTGGQGGRFVLPTEAQWEYACRAGSTTTYCFGDDEARLGDYAWYDVNAGKQPYAVGAKKPNAWGLYDMHGNVWEWCADRYDEDYYAKSPMDDPSGPAAGTDHVLRGGCFRDSATWCCRSASRFHEMPWHGYSIMGFRVAQLPEAN